MRMGDRNGWVGSVSGFVERLRRVLWCGWDGSVTGGWCWWSKVLTDSQEVTSGG